MKKVKPKLKISMAKASEYSGISKLALLGRIASGDLEARLIRNEKNPKKNRWEIDFNSLEEYIEQENEI